MWTKIGSHHLNNLLRNRRFPKRPDMTINVPGLKSPVNIDDNYGLRLTAYYKVGNNFPFVGKEDTFKKNRDFPRRCWQTFAALSSTYNS